MRKKKPEKKTQKEMRAVHLAIGSLSAQKQKAPAFFRTQCLIHAQALARLLFQPDPLLHTRPQETIFAAVSAYEKAQAGFNKAYLQIIGKQVRHAAFEQEKRFFCRFWGRLRHVASEIPPLEGQTRKFYYVPEVIQNTITPAELKKLAELPDTVEFADLRAQLADAINNKPTSFTANELTVIREIHAQVLRRHRPLTFKDDDFTSVSIPLDYRMLPVTDRDLPSKLSPQVRLLIDQQNRHYKFFLSLASPIP